MGIFPEQPSANQPVYGGTITVPIYDAPYTVSPPPISGGAQPFWAANTFHPILQNVGPGADNYFSSQGLFSSDVNGGSPGQGSGAGPQVILYPQLWFCTAEYWAEYLNQGGAGGGYVSPSCIYENGVLSCWKCTTYPYTAAANYGQSMFWWAKPLPTLTPNTYTRDLKLQHRYTYKTFGGVIPQTSESYSPTQNGLAVRPGSDGIKVQYSITFWQYYAGFPDSENTLYIMDFNSRGAGVMPNAGAAPISNPNHDFYPQWETLLQSFYSCTIKTNYLPAICATDTANNQYYNTIISIYDNTSQSEDFPYWKIYGFNSYPALCNLVNWMTSLPGVTTGNYPDVTGIRPPDALCVLGYLWISYNPGQAVAVSPDGSTYYVLVFSPQSANAAKALENGFPSSNAPAIMGDAAGNFWIASNYVASDQSYTYVGYSITSLLELSPPTLLTANFPIPLSCFNPCAPALLNNQGKKQ